jgi:hypothetical protein
VPETLAYYAFPEEHWRRIRTNNPLERIMREIRRRTRVVGAFPDGNSALNLAAAKLRHIAGTRWSTKRYLNMELLKQRNAIDRLTRAGHRPKVRKILDTTLLLSVPPLRVKTVTQNRLGIQSRIKPERPQGNAQLLDGRRYIVGGLTRNRGRYDGSSYLTE